MSDSVTSSLPGDQTTLPPAQESTTTQPTETTPTPDVSSTTPPPEDSTTSTPEPSSETSTPPPPEESTTTTEPPPPETTSTTEIPPPPTESSTSETPEPTTDATTTTESSSESSSNQVTVITVTPTSLPGDTTITITTTSINTDTTSSVDLPSSSTEISTPPSPTSSSTSSATAFPVSGGGGLSQPAKIAIAIIIPIFAVILIAALGIFFWRRYKKRKEDEEKRRKEVEDYGYNPNKDTSDTGNVVIAAAPRTNHAGDMAETDAGYRGWGNTAGGRKASAPLSAGAVTNPASTGYGNAYSDGGMTNRQQYTSPPQPELYGSPVAAGVAPAAVGAAALVATHSDDETNQNRDRHSHSPLLSSPTKRPSTADSSTIGPPAPTGPSELDDGLHRGDSVASSRYTNATRQSEGSDGHVAHGNAGYMNNHPADGTDYYNDVSNPYDYHEHAPEQGYHQPPMIQQVGARRNTRIENAPDTHYAQMPRQGNSGIAQNF